MGNANAFLRALRAFAVNPSSVRSSGLTAKARKAAGAATKFVNQSGLEPFLAGFNAKTHRAARAATEFENRPARNGFWLGLTRRREDAKRAKCAKEKR